jgi:hypothetical protein
MVARSICTGHLLLSGKSLAYLSVMYHCPGVAADCKIKVYLAINSIYCGASPFFLQFAGMRRFWFGAISFITLKVPAIPFKWLNFLVLGSLIFKQ